MKEYNVIVIGGGVNSLAAAAIMAQEEKSVLLFEAKDIIGGIAACQEFAPGFKCNMVYDYIHWIDPRLIRKLDLHQYGLEFSTPSLLRIALDKNGNHLIFHTDPKKTAASIAYHSTQDGHKWPEFTDYISKLTNFLEPLYQMTPPAIKALGIKDAFSIHTMLKPLWNHGSRGLVDIMRSVPMMMPELLDEWFESTFLRGSLAASGIAHITQGPYSAATVLNFLHQHIHANGNIHNAVFIKGGPEQYVQTLLHAAQASGVHIRTGTPVSSINCKDGICTGVTTSNGERYNCEMVISGLDPSHTGIKLVGTQNISPTFQRQLKNIKYRGSTARIHYALNKHPEIIGVKQEQYKSVFAINPSLEYLEHAYDDAKYGRISRNPYIEFSIPSNTLQDHAPSGKHVLSATIQYVPYHIRKHKWNNQLKRQVIQNVSHILGKYIPEFPDIIEDSVIMTPLDLEDSQGLTEGNLNHGELTLDQFFFMRPTISTAQYSTPIQNLFLCGPGTHPGGGLHCTNAVNSVNEIINKSF